MSTHNALTANYSDVLDAYNLCVDGDTLGIPAGDVLWASQLIVTKNISIIGAGAGQTIITENMTGSSRTTFQINLTKELPAPDYSFRLSGITCRTANVATNNGSFISLTGITHANDSPAPYVAGCVSRCRLDHLNWENLSGKALLVHSCLGVGDHITGIAGGPGAPFFQVLHTNWTPAVNPADGVPLPSSYSAVNAFGSWADDPYFGTDKFWFFEDCNFEVNTGALGITDDVEGARVVYRHCTITNGTCFASHGMEGRAVPGVRAREIYNNHLITTKGLAQERSGSVLWFNNRMTGVPAGISLAGYRTFSMGAHWGCSSGDNRYDVNDPTWVPITGTITAVAAPGGANAATVTVGPTDDLSSINLTDGADYSIVDTDDEFTSAFDGTGTDNDPGYQYYLSCINSIAGKVITINHLQGVNPPRSANWQVGHHYRITRTLRVYGACGQGKGNLLNQPTPVSGYNTFTYPSSSGTKATTPLMKGQGGTTPYPLEPCYCWNNTDDGNGYLIFTGTLINPNIKLGRDAFNLAERLPLETQNVGYPAETYTKATSNFPLIGPNSDQVYTPFFYPHPLAQALTGKIISVPASYDFGNIIVGQTGTFNVPVTNFGDTLLTVSGVTYPSRYTGPTGSFAVAAGTTVLKLVTFSPNAVATFTGDIVFASNADSGNGTMAVTGVGVPQAGGGGGGKGHKKGALSRRV